MWVKCAEKNEIAKYIKFSAIEKYDKTKRPALVGTYGFSLYGELTAVIRYYDSIEEALTDYKKIEQAILNGKSYIVI